MIPKHNHIANKPLLFLNPGDIYVCKHDCIIETVLGSCVAVAFWDPILKIGGMNHIVLSGLNTTVNTNSSRFAVTAMEMLAKEMIAMNSKMAHWKSFVIGGSQQFNNSTYTVGNDNVQVAKKWLEEKNIPIKLLDVGGSTGRLVKFEPIAGRIKIINLNNSLLRGKK